MQLFIFGISGKMGQKIVELAPEYGCEITGGFDKTNHPIIPTFNDTEKVNVPFEAIIDFSRPETLPDLIALADNSRRPVVLATTGYSQNDCLKINDLAKRTAVFKSANMSIGITVLAQLINQAKSALGGDFDIEIVEKHHRYKADAPSGTALLLANSLQTDEDIIYARENKREKNQIGISSVRGGTVFGDHEVGFYGEDEIITLSHFALSRGIFARGAIKAAIFLKDKKPGFYDMNDLIKG